MGSNNLLVEEMQVVAGWVPVDLQTGANTGDYVSMKGYDRCTVFLFKAAGTAGDDPTVTMTQAQDVSGTGVKELYFTRIDMKTGTLTSVGGWTTVTQSSANTYVNLTHAEVQAIYAIEFRAEDLDVENGFDCLKISVADIGSNAQIGCAFYVLRDARYTGAGLLSAIAD